MWRTLGDEIVFVNMSGETFIIFHVGLRSAVLAGFELGVQLFNVLNIECSGLGVLYLNGVSSCLLL